jgi:hypothetical protein
MDRRVHQSGRDGVYDGRHQHPIGESGRRLDDMAGVNPSLTYIDGWMDACKGQYHNVDQDNVGYAPHPSSGEPSSSYPASVGNTDEQGATYNDYYHWTTSNNGQQSLGAHSSMAAESAPSLWYFHS